MVTGAAYHLTHRCHDRAFLLKFAADRDRYREILREALSESPVSLLSYCITSNHVHLLVSGGTREAVARLMQGAQGRFAEEYNRRKGRRGAFWSDRYHVTMIGGREHFWACTRYIDLNMVRAGVVKHPGEWDWTAWHEIIGNRKRYRLLDREALLDRCEGGTLLDLQENHRKATEAALGRRSTLKREPYWTEAVAVGSQSFVASIEQVLEQENLRSRMSTRQVADDAWILREQAPQLGLYALTSHENRR